MPLYIIKRAIFFLTSLLTVLQVSVYGQSVYAPLDDDYYDLIDRYYIQHQKESPLIFTSVKPYERAEIAAVIDTLSKKTSLAGRDLFNIKYLKDDNWEFLPSDKEIGNSSKPLLKHLYKKKSDLYHKRTKDFDLHLSPIFHFSTGNESNPAGDRLFNNTRGIKLRGSLDRKIYFFSSFTENQVVLPSHGYQYNLDRIAVPGFGFWKRYNSTGVDYIDARGHIGFNATKHVSFQFGQDKNFIGNGIRSFVLSDFTSSYPFFRIKTKIWKIQYTNLFSQLISRAPGDTQGSFGTGRYPKKFLALHHLSINVSKRLNIGLFESIVTRETSDTTTARVFELSYLNPLIFYRSVEQQSGSPDNNLIGIDFRWSATNSLMIYGQLVLDELVVSKLFGGEGAWENKFATQIGVTYFNSFGIQNLDIKAELNLARPYLYSHNTTANYSHFNQPLAHPFGANFREIIGGISYQIIPRLSSKIKLLYVEQGLDPETTSGFSNFGSDIFTTNENIATERPFGNEIGQGQETKTAMVHCRFSYMIKHNLFFDLEGVYRDVSSNINSISGSNQWVSIGLRLNSSVNRYDY